MAAPTLQPRSGSGHVPAGVALHNGYSSVVRLSVAPTAELWALTVKPPAIEGGDAIKTTTMENTTWQTRRPSALKDLGEATYKCSFEPNIINSVPINIEGSITLHFPDASTLTFFGYVKSVNIGELAESNLPTVDITIVPTNYDPVGKIESSPVLAPGTGT